MLHYINNCGLTLPPVSFNNDPTNRKKPNKNQDSLKVKIKNDPGEFNSEMVLLYIPIFKTSLAKSLLKFLVLLKKN